MPSTFSNRPGLVDGRAFEAIKRAAADAAGREQHWTPPIGAPPRDQFTPPVFTPFQIYQANPVNPDGSPMTDDGTFWRTVSVRSGTVSNFHPVSTGEDSISDDADPVLANRFLTLDENLHHAPVYLECDIETTGDPEVGTQGDVTGVTILSSQSGWENYPREPAGDSGTGAPPAKYYILIGEVSTTQDASSEPESDDETLTIHPANITTNLLLVMEGFGPISCTPNGLVTQQHMVLRSI